MPKLISKRHLRRKIAVSSKNAIDSIQSQLADNSETKHAEEYVPIHVSELQTAYCSVNHNAIDINNQISDRIDTFIPTFQAGACKEIIVCQDNVDLSCPEQNSELQFKENLKLWALRNGVTHRCLNEIISLIKPKYPFLSNDARTLLGTPRGKVNSSKLSNGEMVYFGIKSNLIGKLSTECHKELEELCLLINIDGIPIFNSSSVEFWPILLYCKNFKNNDVPFVVAIFCGVGKPSPLTDFLKEFINECISLIGEGIAYEGKIIKVKLMAFCCDAPARAYLKQITGHNGKQGCERCDITTIYCADHKKRFYPVNSVTNLRSDEDFCHNTVNQHIKGQSPLLELGIGLVSNFVLDPMHLIYLGVMKRLINYWLEGKRQFKLSKAAVLNMNNVLSDIRKHIPSEFGRKIRTFKDVKRWKAVEFRFFLLYGGIKILQNNLGSSMYKHFLLLHVAIYVLCSKTLINKYFNVAKRSLKKFVEKCPEVYDKFFVVYNVHSLTHTCDDVLLYGSLEDFSCFRFESYLGKIKRCVRGKSLPLPQINNRLVELSKIVNKTQGPSHAADYIPCGITNRRADDFFFCRKLIISTKFTISSYSPDNIIRMGNRIFLIKSICMINGTYKCTGQYFKYKEDFYTYPVLSSNLGIFYIHGLGLTDIILVHDILCKYVALPHKNGFVVIPVLHEIKN